MTLRILRRLVVAALTVTAPAVVRAQDPTRCGPQNTREVRGLSIEGNIAYSDAVLAGGIVTEPSSFARRWLRVFGRRRCLDQREFELDVERLRYLYRWTGYPGVEVDTVVRTLSPDKIKVRFVIREGTPTIVVTRHITGLDGVPERAAITAHLKLQEGDPFDRFKLDETRDSITRRLRDNGYPAAEVLLAHSADTGTRRATVEFNVSPGTRARLGDIDIQVTPRAGTTQKISDATVRRLLGVHEGDLYREREVERAKINLYSTNAYRAVIVDVDSADVVLPGDSLVTIHVNLTEDFMRSMLVKGGYGTLDCFRTEGEYRDNNFLSRARRFELRARLSKIGIGRPLSGAEPLCHWLRDDPYSSKLNYHLGSTISEPTASLFGMRPSLTLFSERRSEFKAFLRSTPIGAAFSATRQSSGRTLTLGYQAEYGRTEAQPAVFCALFNLCRAEDRGPLLASRWLATVGGSLDQTWSDDPQYPSRGGGARFELRHASTAVGSDRQLQFSKATADVNTWVRLAGGWVLAPRLRIGAVFGPAFRGTSRFVPAQERLYAGGGNTVRGFADNDLGPKVYVARGYDTVRADGATGAIGPEEAVFFRTAPGATPQRSVPTGGSALIVANLELRVPSPVLTDLLEFAAFIDAGELWSPGAAQAQDRFSKLKFTVGGGIRVTTPVGALRIDVAHNPYAPRAGAAYFDTPIALGGLLYCVSPGNSLAVTGLGVAGAAPVQASGSCAADFSPPWRRGFLRNLKFSFGIGQAY